MNEHKMKIDTILFWDTAQNREVDNGTERRRKWRRRR